MIGTGVTAREKPGVCALDDRRACDHLTVDEGNERAEGYALQLQLPQLSLLRLEGGAVFVADAEHLEADAVARLKLLERLRWPCLDPAVTTLRR